MSENEASRAEFVTDCKRLAEAVVADLFDDAHCPACGWTLFAAYAVLIGVDHWLEEVLEEAHENFGADEDADEVYEKYIDSCHTNIERIFASRLYDVTDWAMKQRYSEGDMAKPEGTASAIWSDGQGLYQSTLDLAEAKREAHRIVDGVFQATLPDLDEAEMSISLDEAWMSIARCALLAGLDPTNDTAVAVRSWALHGVVDDAWSWLLEGAELACAVAEASLLLSDGRIPPPSLEHEV